MEKLAKAHEEWSHENILNEQKICELELEKRHANENFNITNKNLEYLKRNQKVLFKKRPVLKNYYQPSEKMKNY